MLRVIARMNVGGPALQVSALARGLDAERFEQRILVGSVEDGEADYLDLRAPDVDTVSVPGLGRAIRASGDARALRALVTEIRRFRPDVIHTHTAKAGVLGRVAAVACRSPHTVHTFHGHLLHGYFSRAVTAAVRATEAVLARRTDRLVAVGAQVRDDLLAAGIGRPAQFRVVPPGVALPPPPSQAEARQALRLPFDATVIAFVARLTAVKRPDRLLAVARAVLDRHPDAVLAIAGEGPLLTELRQASAPVGDRVRFLGWRRDVEVVYSAADLVLLTSDNEGMPVSLIEAALCGRPAVTTDVGSAGEVVLHGVTGLVVPARVDALTDAVEQLLGDAACRARLGAAAAEHAHTKFGADRLVRDTEMMYGELLGEDVE